MGARLDSAAEMDTETAVGALLLKNGGLQDYARATPFMNLDPETRLSSSDLGQAIAFFAALHCRSRHPGLLAASV